MNKLKFLYISLVIFIFTFTIFVTLNFNVNSADEYVSTPELDVNPVGDNYEYVNTSLKVKCFFVYL